MKAFIQILFVAFVPTFLLFVALPLVLALIEVGQVALVVTVMMLALGAMVRKAV